MEQEPRRSAQPSVDGDEPTAIDGERHTDPGVGDSGAPTDAELLDDVRAGAHRAWETLVHRHTVTVWEVVTRHQLDENDASVVAHLTWLRLLEQLNTTSAPVSVRSWLSATAERECQRHLAGLRVAC